jgi:hypothetical protein
MGYPVLLIIKTILQECTAHFIISYFKDRQRNETVQEARMGRLLI